MTPDLFMDEIGRVLLNVLLFFALFLFSVFAFGKLWDKFKEK